MSAQSMQSPPQENDVLVSETSKQTLTNKTMVTPVQTLGTQVLGAAGSTKDDAGLVTAGSGSLIHATGADGTKGIKLAAAGTGGLYLVKNADAANAILKVYPPAGGKINALSTDGAISMAAKTAAIFASIDGTTWFTFPLLPS